MTKNDNVLTIHVNLDRDLVERFDRIYPNSRRRFVSNAFQIALINRNFFDKIFFKDIIKDNDYLVVDNV